MNIIEQKLKLAEPGTSCVYHLGTSTKGCKYLKAVHKLYDEGRAELVQRRVPDGSGWFSYIIQFRRKKQVLPFEHTFKFAAMPAPSRIYHSPDALRSMEI